MIEVSCQSQILVVEDDRDVRDAIAEVLEDHAYRPIGAANGREALDTLSTGAVKPCVILLDLMMPIMDGLEFRQLQRADPVFGTIPVVVLTAHANIREVTNGMDVAAYLRKPVQLDDLLATIDRICRPGALS